MGKRGLTVSLQLTSDKGQTWWKEMDALRCCWLLFIRKQGIHPYFASYSSDEKFLRPLLPHRVPVWKQRRIESPFVDVHARTQMHLVSFPENPTLPTIRNSLLFILIGQNQATRKGAHGRVLWGGILFNWLSPSATIRCLLGENR